MTKMETTTKPKLTLVVGNSLDKGLEGVVSRKPLQGENLPDLSTETVQSTRVDELADRVLKESTVFVYLPNPTDQSIIHFGGEEITAAQLGYVKPPDNVLVGHKIKTSDAKMVYETIQRTGQTPSSGLSGILYREAMNRTLPVSSVNRISQSISYGIIDPRRRDLLSLFSYLRTSNTGQLFYCQIEVPMELTFNDIKAAKDQTFDQTYAKKEKLSANGERLIECPQLIVVGASSTIVDIVNYFIANPNGYGDLVTQIWNGLPDLSLKVKTKNMELSKGVKLTDYSRARNGIPFEVYVYRL